MLPMECEGIDQSACNCYSTKSIFLKSLFSLSPLSVVSLSPGEIYCNEEFFSLLSFLVPLGLTSLSLFSSAIMFSFLFVCFIYLYNNKQKPGGDNLKMATVTFCVGLLY